MKPLRIEGKARTNGEWWGRSPSSKALTKWRSPNRGQKAKPNESASAGVTRGWVSSGQRWVSQLVSNNRARIINPRTPKVKIHLRTPKGGVGTTPPGFWSSRRNFSKISRMGMFSGSRNPTVITKKFYLHCMTLKIKVKHPFEWPLLSLAVNVVQTWSWCRF